ncbi:MAG: HAMP domain-containing sensor histidine kinase [Cyanobacteria bacterium P01_D01_bin.14]
MNRPLGGLLRETRTRIMLLYAALMLAAVGIAVPIFRHLLFAAVDSRVKTDLVEEAEEFQAVYANWEQSTTPTIDSLTTTINDFIADYIPEDDNFFIFLLDGQIVRANPPALPAVIGRESAPLETWQALDDYTLASQPSGDAAVGDILYVVQPLYIDGERRGQFVIAHLSAGERQEALAGIYVFAKVVAGLLGLAFLLAWLGTGRLLRPVRDLATTARSITETDLTRRIEMEATGELGELTATFNAMMNRIQSAFESQRSFINDAGHELRTPITIIQGHLELMGDDPEDQSETLDIVMNELDRMSRLVNELVLLMKSERSDFLHLETIEVATFTQSLYDKARTLADRDWRLQIETRGRLVADHQRLTGALLNLLKNAAQHTQASDSITLGCRHRDDQVEFWVQDTGDGIPLPEQDRIFDRFARVQHTHRRSEGSGLGLAIVRAIVEAHGGEVMLVSQPGQGAIFTITLPLEPPLEKTQRPTAPVVSVGHRLKAG